MPNKSNFAETSRKRFEKKGMVSSFKQKSKSEKLSKSFGLKKSKGY